MKARMRAAGKGTRLFPLTGVIRSLWHRSWAGYEFS